MIYPFSIEEFLPAFQLDSSKLDTDEFFMNRCLELAFQGCGWAQPNPLVGSVIVHNQQIISEGYHRKFGENHAERMAILNLENKELLKDSTIYVSLEPCSHFGKTPPCSDLILEYKIPKVVVGMLDPNPVVNGAGIYRLRENGVEVVEHILNEQCRYLNRKFIVNQTLKRPFITLKWAESKDGFYAPIPKKTYPISGELSKKITHRLRQSHQAILVGIGTWLVDEPQLNDRYFGGPQPVKLVMTENELWCFKNDEPCVKIPMSGHEFESRNQSKAEFISDFCYQNGWLSLLVEGGSSVWNAFLDQDLVDELVIYQSKSVQLNPGFRVPELRKTLCFQTPISVDLEIVAENSNLDTLIIFPWKN